MTHNQTMSFVVTFIIAFFVGFTTFLFLHNCGHWVETEHFAICHTALARV